MERRFFSTTRIEGDVCRLTGDEAHHLSRVLRASVGEQFTLFDDSGYEYTAEVTSIYRREVQLKIVRQEMPLRELPNDLHMGIALPKGERQKWLIEKAVELGVTSLTPLVAQHGVAQPTSEALERLRRQVIEASKQCARNRLMEIRMAQAVEPFCQSADSTALRLVTHPYTSRHLSDLVGAADMSKQLAIFVAVGPEGGWAEAELLAAQQHGWATVSLGRRILRVETAVCAAAAIIAAACEQTGRA